MNSESNSRVMKLKHWKSIAKKTGKCDRCPPHGGDNAGINHSKRGAKKKRKIR